MKESGQIVAFRFPQVDLKKGKLGGVLATGDRGGEAFSEKINGKEKRNADQQLWNK